MKIEANILDQLFEIYKESLGVHADIPLDKKPFIAAFQFIENHQVDTFDWEALSQSPAQADLVALLKKCITVENDHLAFDELAASAALIPFEQALDRSQKLYLARDVETTGIQEKYLKSQLSSHEPLTELDIKRFIVNTGMQEHIHVISSPAHMGLFLNNTRIKHQDDHEPYSVAFMVNTTSETTTPNWVSVNITINPLSNSVTYTANSGHPLNITQKAALEDFINKGIKFEGTTIAGETFTAFPGAKITGKIASSDSGKLHGYKTLHALYKDKALEDFVADNARAQEFAGLGDDIQATKQFVYQVELEAIQVNDDEVDILEKPLQDALQLGKVKKEVLQEQFDLLNFSISTVAAQQHPLVGEQLAEFQLYHKKVTFPGQQPEPLLSSIDYQQFLLLIHEKLKKSGTAKQLDEMVIACYDNAAIQGLIAYNETNAPVPFKTLTLNLDNLSLDTENARHSFLFHLKTMLLTMSDSNLSALKFIDTKNQMTEEMVEEIARFVANRPIAMDITLPAPFQNSKAQKNIDEATSDTIRSKNIAAFGKQASVSQELPEARQEVRKRPRMGSKQNLAIDIELQQEQQVEVAVDASAEQGGQTGDLEASDAELYTIFKFQAALSAGEFSNASKSFLVDSSQQEAFQLWLNWTGALTLEEALRPDTGFQISKTACAELLRHKDKFQYGIDFSNLPPGFLLKTEGPTTYIHFDENFKLLAEYNPLQVQANEFTSEKPLPHSLFKKWLAAVSPTDSIKLAWDKIDAAEYNKIAQQTFKQFLPQLLLLDQTELAHLFALSFDQDTFRPQQFRFLLENSRQLQTVLTANPKDKNIDKVLTELFSGQKKEALDFINGYSEKMPAKEKHLITLLVHDDPSLLQKVTYLLDLVPTINLNALLQLHLQLGEKGIEQLTKLAESDLTLFKELDETVFAQTKSYVPVLTEEYSDAINAIKGFSANEKVWWNTLLQQHCKAQNDVNLVDMVNAFKAFKEKLKTFETHDEKPLALPPSCAITGVKSLPVALSRILNLLEHSSKQNRHAQWALIGQLDLSSNGAIKLAKPDVKKWAFITPEMRVSSPHETQGNVFASVTQYSAPTRWNKIKAADPADLYENFFRFVAYQEKNGQLPLDFYRHTHQALSDSGLSLEVKKELYPLIAAATTKVTNVSSIKLEEAIRDVDHLIKLFVDTPLPGITPAGLKENARLTITKLLSSLREVPSLVVLNRLVSLISSSLSGPISIARNLSKLERANNDLNRHVESYGSCVYEGLKDYSAEEYNNPQLFFEHMAVVNRIAEALEDNDLDAQLLMRMISSFQITPENIDIVLDNNFSDVKGVNRKRRNEALLLLRNLSVVNHPELRPLTFADLTAILDAVDHTPKAVIDVLKGFQLSGTQPLAAYFPEDILENYGKEGIPEDIARLIATNFSEQQQGQISKLLLRFSQPGDNLHYGELVNKIIAITKTLASVEKNIFVSKLTGSPGLLVNPQALSDENNYFVKLLDSITAKGSPSEFLNFVASERDLFHHASQEAIDAFFVTAQSGEKTIPALAQKFLVYQDRIVPGIKEIENLVIAQLDLSPRLHRVLLKTPVEQLTAGSNVVHDKKHLITTQERELAGVLKAIQNGDSIDLNTIRITTSHFAKEANLEKNDSIIQYQSTLREINKPKNITLEDMGRISQNPAAILLFAYLNDSLPEQERIAFEKRYKEKIEKQFETHPSILLNKDFIPFLQNNPEFFNAMVAKDMLTAAGSPDLLEDDKKLGLLFEGLEKDLQTVADLKNQTATLHQELKEMDAELSKYPFVLVSLFKKINTLAAANPTSKRQFLELYDRYLDHYSPEKHGELLKYLDDFVSRLEKSFETIEDKNIVLSLCLQFNNDKDENFQPEKLLQLLDIVDSVAEKHRLTLLKIAVALINNEKDFTLKEFKELSELAHAKPELADALTTIYKKAPFPTIEQIKTWHELADKSRDYALTMHDLHKTYDKAPCHRELFYHGDPLNGFHISKAQEQLRQFKGLKQDVINIEAFKAKTDAMRDKNSDELLSILAKFNPKNPSYDPALAKDYDTLVAVAAELLHRSKGKDEKDMVTGDFALGSSMEINTTQYLAILSSLKTPGHVTSQIGTGEGKSRIMMISIACQNALGKTVDFVTSDAQLATRDFVEYQAYFEMMGAKSSMIFANTDPSQYQIGGINFSDPSNLSLFRNKARSLGKGELVLDPDERSRALLLDEADKTYFDVADTRFNFSTESDENIRGMSFVYSLLMEYFAQETVALSTPLNDKTSISPLDLYYENIDLSREKFLQFASGKCKSSDLMRLKALSNEQIEQWQVSAVTACQLKFKEDFVIEPDVLISTAHGPRISSEAQLLFANRVSKSSKFSFGVHQCLHAGLNIARNNLDAVKDLNLRTALSRCENPFFVQDEKQIVYSSTSKNLLDDYAKGTLKAVTGTSGSIIERQEAEALYGLATQQRLGKMQFVDVPRDKGMNRIDRAIRLMGNQRQQINTLVDQIKIARSKNQPILIIAENDEESEFLFKKLGEVFKNDSKLQHIHSQLSSKDEKELTGKAGFPGQITVSTDMIGRGTDISLKGGAKAHGLNVMVTYLPRPRDLAQIIGRSGRFGAMGETSLVLDKQRLKKELGKTTLTDGFYANTEAYIEREQALMDRKKQCERLIKNTVGDFRRSLTNSFFDDMLKQVDKGEQKKLLPAWTTFFDKSDKAWNEQWPHIQKELLAEEINVAKINLLFHDYENNVQKLWTNLKRTIQDTEVVCLDGKHPVEKLVDTVPHLELNDKTKKLLTSFSLSKYSLDTWKVYDRYDPGHEGRAVKYSHWSVPFIASLKGYANLLPFVNFSEARRPFANFRAWLEGHGQLFPDFRASPNKGKIIGGTLLGLIGAAIGVALVLTGVLAPLGIAVFGLSSVVTSAIVLGGAGLVAGTLTGLGAGAITDKLTRGGETTKDTTLASEDMQELSPDEEADVPESYAVLHGVGVADVHRSHQTDQREDEVVDALQVQTLEENPRKTVDKIDEEEIDKESHIGIDTR
ncbi:coiled-coil protein (plasmid) [Legionella adelaidensis]|uniref:Coiled-coil protein n=1 Tax=Legionella adelaidensis TaxID=45056 RepID=A0A0W0R2W3_9GAMM|nr:hypothetical protein [Legionella adelaidensis]KTC65423.1 coiled-coil protein [Legionella adelaidensis]VEH84755.1 coiled-coil protein [Legionella adelaidensis]